MRIFVLQVIADSTLSGGPKHLLDLVKNLDKRKFEVKVICPPGPLAQLLKATSKTNVVEVPIKSAFDKSAISKIKKEIVKEKEKNPKFVVHAHGTRAGFLTVKATKNLNIQIIYTEHLWTKDYHLKNPLREKLQILSLKNLGKKTSKIIAVSKAVKNFLTKRNIAPEEKIAVIYNGIEIPQNIKVVKPKDKIIVGSVGSLNIQKGYDYLISAASEVQKEMPEVEFQIVGEGPLFENLKSQISPFDNLRVTPSEVEGSNLKSKVNLLGFVEDLENAMQKFSIYIQPSLSESFGLAILQAMALGLPVVATKVGGIPELVEDGKTGILVPAKNPKILALAILKLLKDKKLAQKLGKNSRQRAKKFPLLKMVYQTEKIYEKVV